MPAPVSSTALFEHWAAERANLESQIQAINSIAFSRDAEHRHYTDEEVQNLTVLQDGMSRVNGMIEMAARTQELTSHAATMLGQGLIRAEVASHSYRSEGEALWDVWHADQDDAARYRLERAAQHMGTTAAETVPTAGGFDGLIVRPSVGPVIRLFPTGTPFLTVIGAQSIPDPGQFTRPRIVDPDLLTAAGPQAGTAPATQKGELPSRKWDYASDLITPQVIGNYINVSVQALTWVPSALQAVIDQLRLRTELGIEQRLVTFADATDSQVTLAAGADAAATQKAMWDAMAMVSTKTGSPATYVVGGPLGTAMIGAKVDLAGRPLFPMLGPVNAPGSASGFRIVQPFGLAFAETPAITDTTLYVGNSASLEAYVYRFATLEAIEPSVLGRQIAAAAAVGFYTPPTVEAGPGGTPPAEHGALVKVAP